MKVFLALEDRTVPRFLTLAFAAVLFALVPVAAQDRKADDKKTDPAAEKLLKAAHDSRASWDARSFPGFTCKLVAVIDGKEEIGKLTVGADQKIKVELPNGPINDWASKLIDSVVSHRFGGTRDEYKVTFVDSDLKHPMGRLISFTGTNNVYRVKDDVITEVHRKMGEGRFTISVLEVKRNPENKYLPATFNVSYWDGSGNLTRSETNLEEYVRVGKIDLPRRRLQVKTGAKGERSVGELRMSDHELLPVKAAAN